MPMLSLLLWLKSHISNFNPGINPWELEYLAVYGHASMGVPVLLSRWAAIWPFSGMRIFSNGTVLDGHVHPWWIVIGRRLGLRHKKIFFYGQKRDYLSHISQRARGVTKNWPGLHYLHMCLVMFECTSIIWYIQTFASREFQMKGAAVTGYLDPGQSEIQPWCHESQLAMNVDYVDCCVEYYWRL